MTPQPLALAPPLSVTRRISSHRDPFDVGTPNGAASALPRYHSLVSLQGTAPIIYIFHTIRGSLITWPSKLVPSAPFFLHNGSLPWSITTSHSATAQACVIDTDRFNLQFVPNPLLSDPAGLLSASYFPTLLPSACLQALDFSLKLQTQRKIMQSKEHQNHPFLIKGILRWACYTRKGD